MSVPHAEAFRDTFPEDSHEWASMDFFIDNAVGHENAITKGAWQAHMAASGIFVSIGFLQNRLIRPARQLFDFFGVKRYRGLYLISNDEDLEITRLYYQQQERAMHTRANNLRPWVYNRTILPPMPVLQPTFSH